MSELDLVVYVLENKEEPLEASSCKEEGLKSEEEGPSTRLSFAILVIREELHARSSCHGGLYNPIHRHHLSPSTDEYTKGPCCGSSAAVTATVSTYLAASSIGQLLFGPWTDYLGRFKVMHFSFLWYQALTIAAVFARSLDVLIILRTFQGLLVTGTIVPAQAVIADVYAAEERGTASGKFFVPFARWTDCSPAARWVSFSDLQLALYFYSFGSIGSPCSIVCFSILARNASILCRDARKQQDQR